MPPLDPVAIESTGGTASSAKRTRKYSAGPLEKYFEKNHYNASKKEGGLFFQRGCPIWREESASAMYDRLQIYVGELRNYIEAVQNFPNMTDVRTLLTARGPGERDKICSGLSPSLERLFPSGELSLSPSSGRLEPL